jgi:hypothetical protein
MSAANATVLYGSQVEVVTVQCVSGTMAAAVFTAGVYQKEAIGGAQSSPYQAFADLLRSLKGGWAKLSSYSLGRRHEVKEDKGKQRVGSPITEFERDARLLEGHDPRWNSNENTRIKVVGTKECDVGMRRKKEAIERK